MKPMLAATVDDVSKLKFPLYASPKLDGVRAIVWNGKLLSRTLKPIPNPHVNKMFGRDALSCLDGELILGDPTADDVYRQTVGAVSREYGEPKVSFYVFDYVDTGCFEERQKEMTKRVVGDLVKIVDQTFVEDADALAEYELECLEAGYEGVMLRSPHGVYKHGRSTVREQGMMKLKQFADSEAVILDIEEEMENTNEAKKNALGRTERSTKQDGLVGKGRAGTLCVRDVHSGVEFRIGTGLDDKDKAFFWKKRKKVVGQIVKYKSFLIGVKDKPRFPVYLGPREEWDL
jgi:DNA ligase-1